MKRERFCYKYTILFREDFKIEKSIWINHGIITNSVGQVSFPQILCCNRTFLFLKGDGKLNVINNKLD